MSERCERTSERTSEWPSTYVLILACSRPRCVAHHYLVPFPPIAPSLSTTSFVWLSVCLSSLFSSLSGASLFVSLEPSLALRYVHFILLTRCRQMIRFRAWILLIIKSTFTSPFFRAVFSEQSPMWFLSVFATRQGLDPIKLFSCQSPQGSIFFALYPACKQSPVSSVVTT